MFGNIDFRGAVILGLIVLPFVGLGYVLGMLHMRENYLRLLRQERIEKTRVIRHAGYEADKQRCVGFAVGYRMGSEK